MRRAFLLRFLFSFVVIAGLSFLTAAQTPTNAPKLVIDSFEHNFGQVFSGAPLTYSFKIRNVGNVDLMIKAVTPSCGCTNSDFDKLIRPGGEGNITLTIPVTDFLDGKLNKFATVLTNDPANESFKLTLTAEFKRRVIGGLTVYPSDKWTTAAIKGTTTSSEIKIDNTLDDPVHVTKVDSGGKFFDVSVQTVQDGREYKIAVVTSQALKLGHYKQTAIVYTDSAKRPQIPLYLDLTVIGELSVTPVSLKLIDLPDYGGSSKNDLPIVTISKVKGELKVKRVSSNLPFLTLNVSEEQPDKLFDIHLTLNMSALEKMRSKGQSFSGYILIETNDKDTPLIQLPVTGTFKTASVN